jgi:hypothetical protein
MDTLPGADVQAFSVERCVFFALAWIFSGVATPFLVERWTLVRDERLFSAERWTLL